MSRERRGEAVAGSGGSLIPGVNLIASCTEENGEISCSVEETNRIRALLGLKPLNTEKKNNEESVAVENFRLKREQEEKCVAYYKSYFVL